MEKVIIIIAAMEDIELNYIKSRINDLRKISYKNFSFYEGKIYDKNIVLCVSGIGLINSAIATTIAVEKYNPYIIINEGLAGGYTEDVKTGDIVIGTECINISSMEYKGPGERLEDYEVTTFLHNEDNRLIYQKADETIINFINKNFKRDNMHFGIIASGDIWNKSRHRIKYINKRYEAICEDMESAAIYTVSNLYNIPVIGIKGISNNEVLGEKYNINVGKFLQELVLEFINSYN